MGENKRSKHRRRAGLAVGHQLVHGVLIGQAALTQFGYQRAWL